MAKIRVEIEVPNAGECGNCKMLLRTLSDKQWVCNAFCVRLKSDKGWNEKYTFYEHIYRCDKCKQAEVDEC